MRGGAARGVGGGAFAFAALAGANLGDALRERNLELLPADGPRSRSPEP